MLRGVDTKLSYLNDGRQDHARVRGPRRAPLGLGPATAAAATAVLGLPHAVVVPAVLRAGQGLIIIGVLGRHWAEQKRDKRGDKIKELAVTGSSLKTAGASQRLNLGHRPY